MVANISLGHIDRKLPSKGRVKARHPKKRPYFVTVQEKSRRPREVGHRPCLFYSSRRTTWSGSGDGAAIAGGDSWTVTCYNEKVSSLSRNIQCDPMNKETI